MALVKCPHCNGIVSDKAVKCPHCGCSLGKTTFIQHGNSIDPIPFATVGKSLLAFIILVGGAMCILPLFINLWGIYAPAFRYYLPVTYVLVSYGILAGLLNVVLAVYGIARLCKHKESTWKFWLLATVFACVSAYGVFRLVNYNDEAYRNLCDKKIEAIKGTYECQLQDGNILWFSITYADTTCVAGGCELKTPNGISKVGYCDVSYFPPSNDYSIYCYDIGMDYKCLYANAEMTILRIGNNKFPLKKISDKTMTEEEYKAEVEAEAEAEAQTKLEEFKNFRSKDLSAFMLHGKVKMVEEGDNKMFFDENGRLTRYEDLWGNTEIEREGNRLCIHSQGGSSSFMITVRYGKIAEWQSDAHQGIAERSIFSNYDENNCPTSFIRKAEASTDIDNIEELGSEEYVVEYSDYDEYGNYRKMTQIHDGYTNVSTRKITYYPIGK